MYKILLSHLYNFVRVQGQMHIDSEFYCFLDFQLNKLYNNKELFTEITNNSSEASIEKFSAENYALNVLKIYNSLLKKEGEN